MTKTYSPRDLKTISIFFVVSGATGLIYEVLWARMLGLVFGATIVAISAVLAAFMGGLALGSALAARFAAKISRPLRVYALIEIVVGLYAVAVPLIFRGIDLIFVPVWQHVHPGFYGFAFSRFLLATSVLLIPTALMGATLPVLVAAQPSSSGKASSAIARLYTWNLTGAIIGTIAAGFFLLPQFGVRATIWVAAAINLLIGLAAFLLDSRSVGSVDGAGMKVVEVSVQEINRSLPQAVLTAKFWLCCAFISGFVTIAMQIVWSRVLAMIIGSSTYAFSIVLALFLIGLALGALLVSRARNPDAWWLRRGVLVIELLTAFTLFLSLRITSNVPDLLIANGLRLGVNSWTGLLALQIAATALLILVPATLMGMVMPLVLMWAGSHSAVNPGTNRFQQRVRVVGHAYALNTIGAIAGSITAAFLLIPGTSTRFTIYCVAALCVIVAGIAYEPRRAADRALARSLGIGGAVTLVIALFAAWPRLNLNALSTGAYDSYVRVLARSRGAIPDNDQNAAGDHQLLMYEEGRTATVSVRRDWGITSVAINGRTNASDADDMPTQVMLGQLGVLSAPRRGQALIIGFATGVTAGSVLQSPIESVDCVEIEPAAVASSRYFEHVNKKPLDDARLHMIIDDARTYLRVNPVAYDLIISEPSHPWVPGVANLFTREFFALGRQRLRDDGVFVQWLQIYQISTDSLRSVLNTFHQTFPYVALFRVQGAAKGKDLILIGSPAPIGSDRMADRINDPRTRAELQRVGIKNAGDLRAWFVCDQVELAPAVAGAVINTDDNMHVETMAPREAFRPTMEENGAWLDTLKSKRWARP